MTRTDGGPRTMWVGETVLIEGLGHPEGPDTMPDGGIVYVETYTGLVRRHGGTRGDAAYGTGGGPNAALRGGDGRIYVTQSGGTVGSWSANDGVPGCLQVIDADGTCSVLAREVGGHRLNAPNDLAFGPDGRLYFTDSGRFDLDARPDEGAIYALGPNGGERLLTVGRTYPNGVALQDDGAVVWVETYTRLVRRLEPDGEVRTLCALPEGHQPDGFKIDAQGRYWITVTGAGGLDVVEPDGTMVEHVATGGVPLNCCFDGDRLIVTDFGTTDTTSGEAVMTGRLVAYDVRVRGQAVHRGAI